MFKEEKAIVGTHIKRIDKFDELTNHFLSVYVSHCIRKKGCSTIEVWKRRLEVAIVEIRLRDGQHCMGTVQKRVYQIEVPQEENITFW